MAQGEFTKEEARKTIKAVKEMFEGLVKTKQNYFFAHLNDILLFLKEAEHAAPDPNFRRLDK